MQEIIEELEKKRKAALLGGVSGAMPAISKRAMSGFK